MLLGDGLLTSNGDVHLRQRRMMQPAFHRERIEGYGDRMVEHALRLSSTWRAGERFDVAEAMMRLTLGVVAETLFSADVRGEADEIGDALTDAMQLFDRLSLPLDQLLDRLPLPATRRFHRARRRLDATIHRVIAEHRAAGDRGDLLSMLLAAQDDEGDGARMSDAQVRDEALTIFLAGDETTALALAWTWHLLSRNPDAEARLHQELDDVLGERPPAAADLPRLPCTRRVIAESMRLYPPAWTLGREPLEDLELGGYRIRAGSIVLVSPWVIQRDPRFFPDPLRFDPDRWLPEAEPERHRFAYFPFGAGPRKCIGEAFAWMEGTLLLATIAREWRVRTDRAARIEPRPLITLRTRAGMPAVAERRRG